MSSYIVDPKTIAIISNYIADLVNVGFNGMHLHYTIPEKFRKNVIDKNGRANPEEIFKRLYNLNIDAYMTRYDTNAEEMKMHLDDVDNFKQYDTQIHDYGHKVQPYHYQLLKSMHCYLYQCAESEELINCTIYTTVKGIADALSSKIIDSLPEYNSAIWG